MTDLPTTSARPGLIGRVRSRQAGHPSGLLGRLVGRLMVRDTAAANERALRLLDLSGKRTVLEVGFGQGRTIARLLAEGHQVIGVDTSPTMVSQATARNRRACDGGRAKLACGDGLTIPFPDDAADAAVTVHTIYFMADPAALLSEIVRVLRPGGRLVIACRAGEDKAPAWMDPDVYRIPTSDRVEEMLRAAGFTHVAHHRDGANLTPTHWFTGDLAG